MGWMHKLGEAAGFAVGFAQPSDVGYADGTSEPARLAVRRLRLAARISLLTVVVAPGLWWFGTDLMTVGLIAIGGIAGAVASVLRARALTKTLRSVDASSARRRRRRRGR